MTHAKSSQLRYTWLEILFKSANPNILLEFHRDTSKYSKTMDKNTRAARSCFHHCFLVFGYPGETLALVVDILRNTP